MPEITYPGPELEVFAHAHNWKQYARAHIRRYLTGDVLEVGAGIGSNTLTYLEGGLHKRWVCLEPDPKLAQHIANNQALSKCELIVGSLADLPSSECFNSIIYMDVLEHITDDAAELQQAALRLRPGGSLVVVAPANQWLFSPFDRAIGHYRRYNAAMLRRISPPRLTMDRLHYLDAVGITASLGNRWILSSAAPSLLEIKIWDRVLVPLSRKVDPLLGYKMGRSILAVWRAPGCVQCEE